MTQQTPPDAAQRRRRILDAARRVFEQEGTLDGGLRRIAAEAGYTTGAIYKLFSGKEDIYAALLEDSLGEFSQAAALAAANTLDPEEALRKATLEFVKYYQRNKYQYHLGLYIFDSGGPKGLGAERDARLNGLLEDGLAVFQVCFQRIGGDRISDARGRELTHALFAALAGVLAMYFCARDRSLKTSWQTILDTNLTALIAEAKR